MPHLTTSLSFRTDTRLARAVERAAKKTGRTRPALIRHVLRIALGLVRR